MNKQTAIENYCMFWNMGEYAAAESFIYNNYRNHKCTKCGNVTVSGYSVVFDRVYCPDCMAADIKLQYLRKAYNYKKEDRDDLYKEFLNLSETYKPATDHQNAMYWYQEKHKPILTSDKLEFLEDSVRNKKLNPAHCCIVKKFLGNVDRTPKKYAQQIADVYEQIQRHISINGDKLQ